MPSAGGSATTFFRGRARKALAGTVMQTAWPVVSEEYWEYADVLATDSLRTDSLGRRLFRPPQKGRTDNRCSAATDRSVLGTWVWTLELRSTLRPANACQRARDR